LPCGTVRFWHSLGRQLLARGGPHKASAICPLRGPRWGNRYRKAAEQGWAGAQSNLGAMYQGGKGVPQDYAEAVKWYRLAANQGDLAGQFNLGMMYEGGKGVPRDHAEAVKWFRKVADQGDARAQLFLGTAYAAGQGVPPDHILAYMWLNLAATRASDAAETPSKFLIVALDHRVEKFGGVHCSLRQIYW